MSGLSDTSAFEAFNRMADKIEEEERRSVAQAEVTEALQGDTLESEFLSSSRVPAVRMSRTSSSRSSRRWD